MDNTSINSTRNKSKHEWNSAHYTQIKVSVDQHIAADFKIACSHSGRSTASILSQFMANFANEKHFPLLPPPKCTPFSVASRSHRRDATYSIVQNLRLILAAELAYRDNIPTNLQNSLRFDNADRAVSALDDAIDILTDAFD
jgi:hypothetical protein